MGYQRDAETDDPYASVESMLRWLSAGLRKRAEEGLAALNSAEELYPLPKPTDGLPNSWAFGQMTSDQVSRASTRKGLRFVMDWIDKADRATQAGDFPEAIFRLQRAESLIAGAWAGWHSAASIRQWRYIKRRRDALAGFAAEGKKARTKYSTLDVDAWNADWVELRAKGLKKRSAALVIANRHGLPSTAAESIRKKLKR